MIKIAKRIYLDIFKLKIETKKLMAIVILSTKQQKQKNKKGVKKKFLPIPNGIKAKIENIIETVVKILESNKLKINPKKIMTNFVACCKVLPHVKNKKNIYKKCF